MSSVKSILFVSHYFYPRRGGVENHVFQVSLELIRRGYKVTVVTSLYDENLKEKEVINEIDVVRIPGINNWNRPSKLRISFWLLWKIKMINKFDIVHFHDVLPWFWFIYPFIKSRKYITFHGYEGNFPISLKAILVRKLSELLTLKNICIGQFIEKWYGTNADEISYGYSLDISEEEIVPNVDCEILYLGRLDRDFGFDDFYDALTKLDLPKEKVHFCGDGEYFSRASEIGICHGNISNPYNYIVGCKKVYTGGYLSLLDTYSLGKPAIVSYSNPLKRDYYEMSPHRNFAIITSEIANLVEEINAEIDSVYYTGRVNLAMQWAKKQSVEKLVDKYQKLWL